jgi:uncharacterized membrane protein
MNTKNEEREKLINTLCEKAIAKTEMGLTIITAALAAAQFIAGLALGRWEHVALSLPLGLLVYLEVKEYRAKRVKENATENDCRL